jgi:Asp-tRNA(Asn)/Glu-tRNA(Gln) amidotransferase A subunit family amidase
VHADKRIKRHRSVSAGASLLQYTVAAMYGTDYSRWDNIKDSDDDATAPAPAPMPPQKPQSDQPLDPTNVAAMRELLHEIDDGRRPHLLAAIEWVEAARATLDRGEAVDDGQCPFDRGSEPWFWFLLLANKPHITLHGPHKPLLARHRY